MTNDMEKRARAAAEAAVPVISTPTDTQRRYWFHLGYQDGAIAEVGREQKAHEAIADILLPLVGTDDGTSVGCARKAAARVRELERQLAEQTLERRQ